MRDRTNWLVFSLIICSLVSAITGIVGFCYLSSDANQVTDVSDNWNSKAIIDIKVSPNNCPVGYQTAYNYVWPGTRPGCWCGDINYFWRSKYRVWSDLYTGFCDYNQTMAGCKDIGSIPSVPINIWSTVNGTKMNLCVQRSSESWLEVAKSYSNKACPPGTIKCGISPDNTFCSQRSQCPINDIQISLLDSKNLSDCTAENNCLLFAQYNPSTAQVIRYKRGDSFDALPTTQFRLNEYGMCKDSKEDDLTPGRSNFQLLLRSKSNCKREGDALWNNTGYSISERQLFDWNGLTNTIQTLNRYGYYAKGYTGDSYQYNLYSRSYIPWKVECRDQMSLFVEKNDSIATLKKVQLALMITCCVLGVILGFVVPVIMLSRSDQSKCIGKYSHYLLRIGLIPLQIYALKLTGNEIGFYSSIAQRSCTTSEISALLVDLEKVIRVTHYSNIISLGIFLFTTLIAFCLFVKDKMQRLNQYENASLLSKYESEPQPNHNDYYSYPTNTNDYEQQYAKVTQAQQQPILYAPPAPTEETTFIAKPLFQPFNVNSS